KEALQKGIASSGVCLRSRRAFDVCPRTARRWKIVAQHGDLVGAVFLTCREGAFILRLRSAVWLAPIIFVMRHPLSIRPLLISGLLTLLSLACASTGTEISDASPAPASQPEPRPADAASGPERPTVSEVQSDRAVPVVARETTPDRTRRESVPAHVKEVRDQMEEA